MRMKEDDLRALAIRIRPFLTPLLDSKGRYTADELAEVCRIYGGHAVRSERSLRIIDDVLCNM
jgi:hypothetical protein